MTDWMTIRVVLAGQADAPLERPPGRTMLVFADHSFADLAEAIDTAFGRWDLTPLHQFEVEGRVLLSAEASGDDPDMEASDEVTVGEVGLRTGARFTYLFDLGEQWSYECVVEDVGIDPFEVAGEEPEVPVPVFGWGTVPDQYGRLAEDDEDAVQGAGAGLAGWDDDALGEDVDDDVDADEPEGPDDGYDDDLDDDDLDDDLDDDDLDDDLDDDDDWSAEQAASWPVVRDALAGVPRQPAGDELREAATRLRRSGDEASRNLWSAAGIDPADAPADEEELWLALAAAVFEPEGEVPLDVDSLAAWYSLEPADWAGAVIEIVREGPGVEVTPDSALAMIARCPEVEETDLTEGGESVLLDGLGVAVTLWRALGVLDEAGRLTALGHWGLPEALRLAWNGQAEADRADAG